MPLAEWSGAKTFAARETATVTKQLQSDADFLANSASEQEAILAATAKHLRVELHAKLASTLDEELAPPTRL